MNTNELFEKVISQRGWYKPLGILKQNALTYKKNFQNEKLGEVAMSNILEKLGYEKTVSWVESNKNGAKEEK
jgi:hypothetical protein